MISRRKNGSWKQKMDFVLGTGRNEIEVHSLWFGFYGRCAEKKTIILSIQEHTAVSKSIDNWFQKSLANGDRNKTWRVFYRPYAKCSKN